MEIYTIGFTKKSAAEFFGLLRKANIGRLIDVRLNNSSQLAGFTKRDDLQFFLREIERIEYAHEASFAPSKELFDAYKKQKGSWETFEQGFMELMKARRVDREVDKKLFDTPSVLLCSEPTAECCHRRLVTEYLNERWGNVQAVHL